MEWLDKHLAEIISILFGAGGLGYACTMRYMDRKKYKQEVREATSSADLKGDEFWKKRYDVLESEVENKDNWWKERYNTLYNEYQNDRNQNHILIKTLRTEFNEMRSDYERQREIEKQKYDELLSRHLSLKEESNRSDMEYKARINNLEQLIIQYEKSHE